MDTEPSGIRAKYKFNDLPTSAPDFVHWVLECDFVIKKANLKLYHSLLKVRHLMLV